MSLADPPGPGWTRHYDESTSCHYHFNQTTGESRWDVPPVDGVSDDVQNPLSADWMEAEAGSGSDSSDEGTADPTAPAARGRAVSNASSDDNLDTEPMVNASEFRQQQVMADTDQVMCCYSWCLYCHSCLCEAPFAVAEGVVRFGLHTTGALFCCVQGTLIGLVEGTGSGQGGGTAAAAMSGSGAVSGDDDAGGGSMSGVVLERARLWCKEGVVSLAASVSLLVPCCACYVYRKFDADADEWELSPIPTLCGSVDPRRFCTFAFGQGADASNIVVDESNQNSMDSLPGPILHAPRNLVHDAVDYLAQLVGWHDAAERRNRVRHGRRRRRRRREARGEGGGDYEEAGTWENHDVDDLYGDEGGSGEEGASGGEGHGPGHDPGDVDIEMVVRGEPDVTDGVGEDLLRDPDEVLEGTTFADGDKVLVDEEDARRMFG